MDDADVVDHEELQQVRDVKQGQVEGDGDLHNLYQGHHSQVGDGA